MIKHFDTINCLADQIAAILDLMQCATESPDITSFNVSAEMCQTMLTELMAEV